MRVREHRGANSRLAFIREYKRAVARRTGMVAALFIGGAL